MGVKLMVVSGPMAGREFAFGEPDVLLFGRAADCHCCLPNDPYVSRHHFLLEVSPPACQLRDLGSLNGTHVNGVKYGGRREGEKQEEAAGRAVSVEVGNGDRIRVGKTELAVAVEEKQVEEPEKERGHPLEDLLADLFGDAKGALPQIPGYESLRELGKGGFGKVYLVRRRSDGKELALKVIRARKRQVRQEDIRLFQREMEICMALKHPRLVAFEEQGYAGGLLYFVMEYCRGGSLRDLAVKRGARLSVAEVVPLLLQAMEGLAHAHQKGYVHRDLKPENILLDGALKVAKVSDFGLAKSFQKAGLSGFTLSGSYAGTYQFMPKEQITDYKHVKPVSDVFAMGATLYNVLTGHFVYDFLPHAEPLRAVLEGRVVPIARRRRDLPEKLAAVIDKAISPEPEDRYETAGEMKRALERTLG